MQTRTSAASHEPAAHGGCESDLSTGFGSGSARQTERGAADEWPCALPLTQLSRSQRTEGICGSLGFYNICFGDHLLHHGTLSSLWDYTMVRDEFEQSGGWQWKTLGCCSQRADLCTLDLKDFIHNCCKPDSWELKRVPSCVKKTFYFTQMIAHPPQERATLNGG